MLIDGRGGGGEFTTYQAKDIESNLKEETIKKISKRSSSERKWTCYYCGEDFPHKKVYPAMGKQCKLCRKYNRFSDFCPRL